MSDRNGKIFCTSIASLSHISNSAGEITDHFDISAAAISRHLSVLKDADLVYDSREGKFIYYTLNTSVLEETMLWLADLKGD